MANADAENVRIEKSLQTLKTNRASTKGSISRIKSLLDSKTLEFTELECRLGILESYFKQALNYQTKIEELSPMDNSRPDIEELYCTTKTKILSLMGNNRRSSVAVGDTTLSTSLPFSRLPLQKLPKFSGKYCDYKNFIGLFKTLVHNDNSIAPIEKFNHLISCLSEQARGTIKSFQVTEENYSKALNRLEERYDKKGLIFLEYISSLFDLPKMKGTSSTQLRSLVDDTSALFDSLKSLGSYEEICNATIIHLVMSKVDTQTHNKWNESLDYMKLPKWENCSECLNNRCQFLESKESKTSSSGEGSELPKQAQKKPSHVSLSVTKIACLYCKSSAHHIVDCNKFKKLRVYDRYKKAKALSLCINCLSKGHGVKECSAKKCEVCSDPHHLLLHRYGEMVVQNEQPAADAPAANSRTTLLNSTSADAESQVVLATVVVRVRNKNGEFIEARALLDSGSQINLMTQSLAKNLQLKSVYSPVNISGVSAIGTKIDSYTMTSLQSRFGGFEKNIEFWIARSITDFQPQKEFLIGTWNIPENLQLADPSFYKPQRVDMLLGAELFFDLMETGKISLGPNLPMLQKTVLGWVVSGSCLVQRRCCNLVQLQLDKMVERFWTLEEISPKSPLTLEQERAEEHFKQNYQVLQNGRIRVKLPFKEIGSKLGNSLDIAKKRFYSLERRLNKDLELKQQYSQFIQEYLQLGHMSLVEHISLNQPHYFMPHQCVLRPESSSTKLRVVFDASCRTTSKLSLNNVLMVGPTIQEEMYSIVLRFRTHRFALTADIRKMYRQIEVDPDDRRFQLILWRNDSNDRLQTYCLNTVTYGTSAAPFLATRSLKEIGIRNEVQYPVTSKVIQRDFYVDDLITGANTIKELIQIQEEVTQILGSANFELHKWHSNASINPSTKNSKLELKIDEMETTKTLGIEWNPKDDVFNFFAKDTMSTNYLTKRTVLSDASRLFDPLGLLGPIVVRAKLFLQTLWAEKLGWDDPLPVELGSCWKDYVEDLQNLKVISIPRFIFTPKIKNIQIHGFADASIKAYGCCLYARCEDECGNIFVRLITGKSRVAPSKTQSIPRLELCGAQLLAKLYKKVEDSLKINSNEVFFWVDSEIVLYWLSSSSNLYGTFVANRVSDTQSLASNVCWRHVRSENNPADLISRGSLVNILNTSIWFEGPQFLKNPSNQWPENRKFDQSDLDTSMLETKKKKTILVCSAVNREFLETLEKYSNFSKTVRIIAYILRFCKISRAKGRKELKGTPLSAEELNEATMSMVWCIQQECFATEIAEIHLKKDNLSSKTVSKLSPFLDVTCNRQLLRVGGRIRNSDVEYDAKFPILLPGDSYLVREYVRDLHIRNYHAGPQALLNFIRDRFWIVNARKLARQVINKCINCIRYKPKLLDQVMGNLPKDRVTPGRPFDICGVDFCGPMLTSWKIRGKVPYKSYVSVFVCFATKAVHFELVSDLSSDAFIAALKRFIGRRGCPSKIHCDNATNFVGAKTKLKDFRESFFKQLNINSILEFVADKGIQFEFIPPRAPHFGGIWEAAVKSAKTLLTKTLGGALLTFEELNTALVEVEAILNSRPLTAISTNPRDFSALTPGHFLIGSPMNSFPEPERNINKISSLHRWQRITALKQHFWKRWSTDYLRSLQEKSKWFKTKPNVEEGSLVVMQDENLPPYKWALARVERVIRGNDDKVRVVDLKTAAGRFRRPITKIAPLNLD